jgi:uncharacterized protein (TIGR04141 family)
MAKYNIYQVKPGKAADLVEKLKTSGYEEATSQILGAYKLTSYFTALPKPTEIWWLTQFAAFFSDHVQKKNTVYSGAIVAENQDTGQAFLLALGKTHFYAQEFIDYTFGLKVAERIGSNKGAKTKSLKHFAGQTSKSMISFSGDSVLSFKPGEATDYVKLKATDADKWGKSYIHFGTSVQFGSIDYEPDKLNDLLANIEGCLEDEAVFSLPMILPVKDETQIQQLDKEVSQAITGDNASLSVVDFELYGVDFVFSQQTHVRLEYDGVLSDNITELDIAAVKKFAEDNSLDLDTTLRDINAKLYVNDSSKFTVPLIKLLDYVGDSEYFLYRGKWYIFSESFLNSLLELIKTAPVEQMQMEFTKAEHQVWQTNHEDDEVKYRERYVIDKIVQANEGFRDIDRVFDYKQYNGKKAKIEVSDIYDPAHSEINVVKIGEAKDFGYAFDQAALVLTFIQANKYVLGDGSSIEVKRLRLTLVSSNVTTPESPADINSLSFQIKLGELMNLAREKSVDLVVTFAKYS